MNFQQAIEQAKLGKKITRKQFETSGYFVSENDYDGDRLFWVWLSSDDKWEPNLKHLGNLLATDWEVVEEKPKLTYDEKFTIDEMARLQFHNPGKWDWQDELFLGEKNYNLMLKLVEAWKTTTETFWKNLEENT